MDGHTYNDLYRLVKQYDGLLTGLGVGKKDRVCWDACKSIHWPAVMLATWKRGAVFVPLNHGNVLLNKQIISKVKPKAVLTDGDVKDTQPTMVPEPPPISMDTASTILFTSGSTHEPKGVVLSHKNILTNLEQISHRVGDDIDHTDSAFSILPWHHCYGLVCELLFLLTKNAHISLPTQKDPKKIIREMRWQTPSLFYAVPKVLENIYKNDFHRVPGVLKRNLVFGHRIRRISVGGALCPPKLVSFMSEEYKVPTLQGYGMTETSPMISLNSIYENRIGSVGKPVKNVRIDFSNENNEILVRGDNIMSGYLKFITKENVFILEHPDGWFSTGDNGYMDKDGFLYINGRTKLEYKLSNGKYINPNFIEKLLCLSPWIDQAVVFGDGLAHNKVIVHGNPETKDAKQMLDHVKELLRGRVQNYEVPNEVFLAKEPFSLGNGLLTQKLEPNRNKILKLYASF
jgi:long-subunit acyl-CoA synthetase (AMP-forming)